MLSNVNLQSLASLPSVGSVEESKQTMLDEKTMKAFNYLFKRRPAPASFEVKPAPKPGVDNS